MVDIQLWLRTYSIFRVIIHSVLCCQTLASSRSLDGPDGWEGYAPIMHGRNRMTIDGGEGVSFVGLGWVFFFLLGILVRYPLLFSVCMCSGDGGDDHSSGGGGV